MADTVTELRGEKLKLFASAAREFIRDRTGGWAPFTAGHSAAFNQSQDFDQTPVVYRDDLARGYNSKATPVLGNQLTGIYDDIANNRFLAFDKRDDRELKALTKEFDAIARGVFRGLPDDVLPARRPVSSLYPELKGQVITPSLLISHFSEIAQAEAINPHADPAHVADYRERITVAQARTLEVLGRAIDARLVKEAEKDDLGLTPADKGDVPLDDKPAEVDSVTIKKGIGPALKHAARAVLEGLGIAKAEGKTV